MELAEIFRQYGPAYREKFGEQMPSNHLAAMRAIENCRTEALGGHLYYCPSCDEQIYSYHSCPGALRARHCPKCQHEAAQVWLEKQCQLLLPVPYFLVTFTLPAELRQTARSNQQVIYNLLFRSAAQALQILAQDRIGGQFGMVGILQTWTRDLRFHPHIHFLVPGGGLSEDGKQWFASPKNFLVRVEPLGLLFRKQFRAALKKTPFFAKVPSLAWDKAWVVDSRPVGTGEAALKYRGALWAPYVFRVAISNNRILKLENDKVTFRYREGDSGKWRTATLPAEEFIRRFLQHVLPKGFVKVRYFGLFAPSNRHRLTLAQALLATFTSPTAALAPQAQTADSTAAKIIPCPRCGNPLTLLHAIPPTARSPPSLTSAP
jgi:hypothetical protein